MSHHNESLLPAASDRQHSASTGDEDVQHHKLPLGDALSPLLLLRRRSAISSPNTQPGPVYRGLLRGVSLAH